MSKWEKWIKEYGKRNYRHVLIIFLDTVRGMDRFDSAAERAKNALRDGKRFYLKNEEKLDLITEWKNRPLALSRALALSWCCNCEVTCFSYPVTGEELILTYDGYYVLKGDSFTFTGTYYEKAEGVLCVPTLQDYLQSIEGYKEEELWRLK